MKYLNSLFIFLHAPLLWRQVAANQQLSSVGTVPESGNVTELEKCEFPLVSTVLFADRDSREVNLTYLNSSSNLNVEQSFPYQYFMLTCSASYPVEWVVDTPEPNYYSYILDEEVRTNVSFNDWSPKDGTKDDVQYGKEETFIIRHHIGNKTLAKDSLNLTYACQPVQGETAAYHQEHPRSCGNTLFQLKKHDKEHKAWNKTTVDVLFNEVALANSDFANASMKGRNVSCLKDEKWSSTQRQNLSESTSGNNSENEMFICKSSEYQYSTESTTFSSHQLQFNISDLVQKPFGLLQCTSVYKNHTQNENNLFHVPYYFSLPKLCSTEDSSLPHLYLRHSQANGTSCAASDLVNEEELLSLCVQNTVRSVNDIYVGDEITVTCISAIYYFAEGMRVQVTNMSLDADGHEKMSQIVISKDSKEQPFGPGGYRNLTTTYKIQTATINQLQCLAPVRKSRRWVVKTIALDIKSPEKLSFDGLSETATSEGSETFLLCNATGDPIPILSWSRLNNGKLPANQTTEIHSFAEHPTPGGQPPRNKSGSTWISSKLHLPTGEISEKELAEYYGRYICTAKNRFQSIEKVFLYDKEGPFQNAILKSIGKTVWFWVLVVLAMFVLIGLVIVLGLKVRQQTRNLRIFTKTEIDEFMFGKPELLLDDSENYEEINSYASYLPYDRNQFEIKREQLEFSTTDILGSGAYGTVYKGKFTENGKCQTVAIKTVNETSDKMYFAALLSEIKIMCYIGNNENVVRLIGACTKYLDRRQIFVATEFCENGDLLSYIQKHRETFINNAGIEQRLAEAETRENGSTQSSYIRLSYARLLLSPRLLLVWALQISKGMAFLSSKKVIHGDLAARNILLGTDLQPKLGDFGLSKQLQNYANYVQKGDELVPWKWLAIECLQFMKFSLKSDVWAFGVVLYEILTLGKVPYANYTYSELFIVALCHGERLPKPLFATDKLYSLMLDCWKHSPEDRPTFTALENALKILILENENLSCNSTRKDIPVNETEARRPPQEAISYVITHPIQQSDSSYVNSFNPDTDTTPPQTSSYVADWNTVM